jgi:hypothetical protein
LAVSDSLPALDSQVRIKEMDLLSPSLEGRSLRFPEGELIFPPQIRSREA